MKRKLVDLPTHAEKVVNPERIKPYQENGVILGIRCGAETLEKIDECNQAKAVVLLAFNEKEGRAWAKKHGAKIVNAPAVAKKKGT